MVLASKYNQRLLHWYGEGNLKCLGIYCLSCTIVATIYLVWNFHAEGMWPNYNEVVGNNLGLRGSTEDEGVRRHANRL